MLNEIRARLEAATPGPWEVIQNGNTIKSHAIHAFGTVETGSSKIAHGISPKTGNAHFIAHAPSDIAFLIGEVERLTALNVERTEEIEWLKEASKIIEDKARVVATENGQLHKDKRNLRNELCLKCGRYHEAHNGACNGCKWKEELEK